MMVNIKLKPDRMFEVYLLPMVTNTNENCVMSPNAQLTASSQQWIAIV